MEPNPREDIAEDTNHFHRFPLFLRSWQSDQPNQTRWEQLTNHVLQKVDGAWLCATFIEGTCGVYRYSYDTEGIELEGYDLSGTFLLGWWSLLKDSRVTQRYRDILETYPMEGTRSNPYFDHATVREQNPFFDMDTGFDLGMFECMTMCAAKLGA